MPGLLLWHPRVVVVQVDADTVYLDLQPSSTEELQLTDSDTVYLDIQIISIVAPTMDLVVMGMGRRFAYMITKRFEVEGVEKAYVRSTQDEHS